MNREDYARNFSGGHAMDHGRPVIVPDNVERVSEHTPCFLCGVRAGLPCRHRRIAA
jgi:hypothetical protein